MNIGSNALAFQSCEAPGAATEAQTPQQGRVSAEGNAEGFADELKSCQKESPPETDELKPPEKSDADKDNGMQDNPGTLCAAYGIVGILEGFEPPGYQTDNAVCIVPETAGGISVQNVPQGNWQTEVPVKTTQTNEDDTSAMPGQIAWTHQTSEAGVKPAQTQDEILQIVGEYLDSLENTSTKDVEGPGMTLEAQAPVSMEDVAAAKASGTAGKETQTLESVPMTEQKQPAERNIAEAAPPDNKGKTADTTAMKPETVKDTGAAMEEKPEQDVKASKADRPVSQGALHANATAVEKAAPESAITLKEAGTRPEAVKESVIRIVDKVSTKAAEGQYDFEVDLKPGFLGKVSIKLTMKDGDVRVHIKADDIAVKGMLSDQTSSLQALLKEKGISVSVIDVAYEAETTLDSGQARQGSEGNPESSFYQGNEADSGTYESAREVYDFYYGNSSVEFLA